MRERMMYVELKSGSSDDGPAWIGRVRFSKSGRSIYYRERTLRRAKAIRGNHIDVETGEEFWVSGPRRDGRDRLCGNAPVHIDEDVRGEYEALTVTVRPRDARKTHPGPAKRLGQRPDQDLSLGAFAAGNRSHPVAVVATRRGT